MRALIFLTLCISAQSIAAQEPPTQNEIVVAAQRSGAPMWTIYTDTGTVILVGEIRAVPESTPWFPDRLKDATGEADRVIIRSRPKISPGDVFRLIFRGGSFTKLPDKSVAADYLDLDQRARLAALEQQYDKDYDRGSFLMTAFDLLARRLDFDDDTLDDDATDIVRKAAKKADVPIERPERFRGEDLLDNLAEAPPASHIACLEAAMTATEMGPDIIEKRGDDWRKFDIPAVMENPLEVALGTCWPWADPELGEDIRATWIDMIEGAAASDGTTVAVVPLRVLAESEGVLDSLETRGFEIGGPLWR
ncbi:TraB/GumN family protein [Erythrobacter sp. F6033]|uniref:TraB/GumN family protein n=1 Tax=Erythrobacter sp. F6033 TaxID=2926401 RepID=UPI001FF14D4E|nr:TraB/GumN family protein [Erythrobacter sp. F6033]MCK0129500.1 TraB/GumN family protein [Erythrobacter sp. F6033]